MISQLALPYWLPILVLSGAVLLELCYDGFLSSPKPAQGRWLPFWTALLGLIATLVLAPLPKLPFIFGRQMLVWDALSFVTVWISVLAGLAVLLLSERSAFMARERSGPYYALVLLATLGLFFLGMANDLLMVFLAMELVGIPLFILTGYTVARQKSIEAATKFFLVAVFSSGMLVYGISLIYGVFGSTSLNLLTDASALSSHSGVLLSMGLALVLIALGYKVGLVPFHLWVPDAFTGAPTPIAAYLSIAPKIAGLIVLARVFATPLAMGSFSFSWTLAVLAALTIFTGTLVGLRQTNVVRLLAYSSIAHMGYMLLGVLSAPIFLRMPALSPSSRSSSTAPARRICECFADSPRPRPCRPPCSYYFSLAWRDFRRWLVSSVNFTCSPPLITPVGRVL